MGQEVLCAFGAIEDLKKDRYGGGYPRGAVDSEIGGNAGVDVSILIESRV